MTSLGMQAETAEDNAASLFHHYGCYANVDEQNNEWINAWGV